MTKLCWIAASVFVASAAQAEPSEIGVFAGGFVSNYFHQFYDASLFTAADRPRLAAVNPQLGARVSYVFRTYFAVETEASMIIANVVDEPATAMIYNLRAQLVAQYPGALTPFADVGIGLAHLSSDPDVLGNDTDFPLHVGIGARWYVADGLALRVDARLLRGPGATYGDFSVGLSFAR